MKEKEAGTLKSQFLCFLKENPLAVGAAVFFVLLSYGGCLGSGRIGIDSEMNLNNSAEFLDSWYSIGRFSLVFIKTLFGMRELNPDTANLLMIGSMILYGVAADFVFYIFSGKNPLMKPFYILFPALFVTHPCYAQQYIFTVQSFEVALLTSVCLAAVFCASKWAFEDEKRYLLPAVCFAVLSFGGYQAFVPFYMSAALAVYLVYYYFHDRKEKGFYFKAAVCHTAVFFISYAVYLAAVKAVIFWKKGAGFQGEYLEEQLLWSVHSADECIGFIKHYIQAVLWGESAFYPKTFLFFALIFAAHLLFKAAQWYREKRKGIVFCCATALALAISPFYLVFYQGGGILERTQFSLPFTAAFFGAASVSLICGQLMKKQKEILACASILILVCSIRQANFVSRAIFSANMTYEHDKMLAQRLAAQIEEAGGTEGQKIAILGTRKPHLLNGNAIREEVIGYSFFEWDADSAVGVTNRGVSFMKTLGYSFECVNPAEYELAKEFGKEMPDFPDAGSIVDTGAFIVVKISGSSS